MPEKSDRSRGQMLKGTEMAELPTLKWGEYLVDDLLELGPPADPVSYQEIEAWARLTKINLDSYEVLLLRDLSFEYCRQLQTSRDQNCPMPGQPESERRAKANEGFKQLVTKLKAAS